MCSLYNGNPYTDRAGPLGGNTSYGLTLQWPHNEHDCVSKHQPHSCLLNRLFRRRSEKTLKLRVTGLCAGNSPGTSEFPAQMTSNAENVSIWWHHHDTLWSGNAIWQQRPGSTLTQVMACVVSPLTEPMLTFNLWDSVAFTWQQYNTHCPC